MVVRPEYANHVGKLLARPRCLPTGFSLVANTGLGEDEVLSGKSLLCREHRV